LGGGRGGGRNLYVTYDSNFLRCKYTQQTGIFLHDEGVKNTHTQKKKNAELNICKYIYERGYFNT
jgi:hypothetical protein